MQVIHEADQGEGPFRFGRQDGVMTRQELDQYSRHLEMHQRQLELQRAFARFTGRDTFAIDQQLHQLREKQQAANTMRNNWGTFANNSGNGTAISGYDVWRTASRDGNGNNISWFDLNPVSIAPPPRPWPQPPVYPQPPIYGTPPVYQPPVYLAQ